MIVAYIGLGSNLEQPQQQIQRAITAFQSFPQSQLLKVSSCYLSKPWGEETVGQPDYINAVISLNTQLSAQDLLAALFALEQQHNRVRLKRNAARTLDCDLLLYGCETIQRPDCTVPHPHMTQRAFVLLPLYEINPHGQIRGKPIADLLKNCDCSQLIKIN